MKQAKKILVIGIGNTLRGDDGIGKYICTCIEKIKLPNVSTTTAYQLETNLLEAFIQYDTIIIADASISGRPVSFINAATLQQQPVSSSHHADAKSLAALAKQLYKKDLEILLCAVRGENFDMGEQLSATAIHNANDAVNSIVNWIKNNPF